MAKTCRRVAARLPVARCFTNRTAYPAMVSRAPVQDEKVGSDPINAINEISLLANEEESIHGYDDRVSGL